jgi:hypothetical protein
MRAEGVLRRAWGIFLEALAVARFNARARRAERRPQEIDRAWLEIMAELARPDSTLDKSQERK